MRLVPVTVSNRFVLMLRVRPQPVKRKVSSGGDAAIEGLVVPARGASVAGEITGQGGGGRVAADALLQFAHPALQAGEFVRFALSYAFGLQQVRPRSRTVQVCGVDIVAL